MSEKLFYPIVVVQLDQENGGGFLAYAPDLRGCESNGETAEQAVKNTQQAVNEWLDKAAESKREVPLPSSSAKAAEQVKDHLFRLIQEHRQTIQRFALDLQLARVRVWL